MKNSLLSILFLMSGALYSFEPVLGRDYSLLESPLPIKKDGNVEVLEIFWYGCGHCYSMESKLKAWNKTAPEYVKFKKMPVTWGPIHQLHAKLFYTIEALQMSDTAHSAVFSAIHKEGNSLASDNAIIDFLEKLGAEKSEIIKYMNSFSVRQKVKRAIEISKQFKVIRTPMMFVDGKYRVEAKGGTSKMLRVVDHIIEIQKPIS